MQVYAPIPEEDLNALECEIRGRMPARLDSGRRTEFLESVSTLVKSFNTLNDAPLNYLASVTQVRAYFSRLQPWQPTFELIATARNESTQGLYRALSASEDYIKSKRPVESVGLYTANGQFQPIVHRLDGQPEAKAVPAGQPTIEDLAAREVHSALAARMFSTSTVDLTQRIRTMVDSRFPGESPTAADERHEMLAEVVAGYGFDLIRRG